MVEISPHITSRAYGPDDMEAMKEIKTATISRPIGYLESWYRRNDFNLVAVAKVEGNVDMEKMKMACRALSIRHPLLRVNIDLDHMDRRICFKELVHHSHVEPKKVDSSLSEFIESELNKKFQVGGSFPLWSLSLLREGDQWNIVISMHRCIADSVSANIIVESLLRFYAKDHLDLDQVKHLPMTLDAEELRFFNDVMDETRVKQNVSILSDTLLKRSPADLLDKRGYKYHQKHMEFTSDTSEWEEVENKLKRENVSVRSFIATVILRSLVSIFGGKRDEIFMSLSVNLRDLVRPSLGNEHVGLLNGFIDLVSPKASERFWEACKHIEKEIDYSIETEDPMYWHAIHRTMNDYSSKHHDHAMKNSGRYGDVMLEISTPLTLNANDALRLTSMHTFFSNKPFGWTFNFVMNIVNGRMCLTMTYDSALIEDFTAKQLFDHATYLLLSV